MDYGLAEEQLMFKTAIRDFLEAEWSVEAMREAWDDKNDYPLEVYRKMGGLGWLGLMIPEQYGGMGLGWVEAAILFEEAGRVLLKGPLLSTAILGAQALLLLGTEEQKREMLPKVAAGDAILAWAYSEPETSYNLDLISTKAVAVDNHFHINGQKLFVSNMRWADYVMTIAKVEGGTQNTGGPGIFLVDTKSTGLSYELMDGMDGDELAEVTYNDVLVTQKNLIGRANSSRDIRNIVEKSKIAYSAEMIGGTERALELSVSYGNTREQFGRLIGSFQAIQHKLATVDMLLERSRWLAYYAAYLCTQGINCTAEINMAYLASNEAYRLASAEGIQIHGGSGCMRIDDIGRYFQRAKALQLKLEPAYVCRERIAQILEEKGANYGVQVY
jgi:alkylation response protein AidB-like acyl-CoA dehydrogenase